MIDANKQYTCGGKQVRIYADGSDTYNGAVHGAYLVDNIWFATVFDECELTEVWGPKEGEWCLFWSEGNRSICVSKFKSMYRDKFKDMDRSVWDNCSPFTGIVPEVFTKLESLPEIGQEYQGGTYIGTLNNHAIIVAPKYTETKLDYNEAIEYCSIFNGYKDWYLPSKEELDFMYKNKQYLDIDQVWYWANTECSSTHAWVQSFGMGSQTSSNKTNLVYARGIRTIKL